MSPEVSQKIGNKIGFQSIIWSKIKKWYTHQVLQGRLTRTMMSHLRRLLLLLSTLLLNIYPSNSLLPNHSKASRITRKKFWSSVSTSTAAIATTAVATPPISSGADNLGLVIADTMGVTDGRMDMSTMPDPIVPVFISFAILVGVGFLQMSLGDVYADEAALPLSSGVKAKREMERKTKSYFTGSGGTIENFDDD